MAHSDVSPKKLRFTQDSIKNTFKEPYEYQHIDDAVDQIGNKQLNPAVLMPLTVVHHKSMLWSLDNRRLWVLRKAGVPTVKCKIFSSCMGGDVRSVGINRGKGNSDGAPPLPIRIPRHPTALPRPHLNCSGAPPPPVQLLLNHPTTIASTSEANRTPSPPPPHPLRDITVRSNIPPLVSSLPNAYHHTHKYTVPKLSNTDSGPGGNKGSDSLWGRILNVVNCVMDPCNKKVVRLGKNLLIVLGFCFALCQAYKLGKGGVNSKLEICETITISEGGENIFRGGNGRGSCENVVSDQNNNNRGVSGYLSIIAVKGIVGMGKIVSHILSNMFCFLRFAVRNAVDLSQKVVVGSGRKTLDACGVILSQCFSCIHSIPDHVAVRLGRMGICVSEFYLEKFWELLRFIKCQAFELPGQMVGWSLGKVQDALSFFLNEIKEFLLMVVWSPQIALSFSLNKVKESAQDVLNFCLYKIKELLGLQGLYK
ncbi:hypothetical protein SUGI_0101660 [Cryptomeria japonica]|nr:hypothetical protein SUGI_0101660 [Cryptomeria japonica]